MSIAICAGNANSPNPSIFVSGLCNNLNSWIQASQTRITVYGVVKEAGSNQPLVGVNVYIKGTTEGTITDSEGGYSLSLPDGKHVLVFSSIGFKNFECDVNSSRELNVTLDPDSEMLSEVVYIGYMSQKKADITGAISIVP
jgi:PPE-repeat protein